MLLEPPKFWSRPEPDLAARFLAPVGSLIAALGRARFAGTPGYRLNAPIICVGNVGVGGSGKTPLVRLLLQMLCEAGLRPYALTRGYGGRLRGPVHVDPRVHGFREVGDEALLLDAAAPVIVARDRAAGAEAAARAGAHVIVCDDGLQNHPSLYRDCALLAVPTDRGFGNGLLIPAGPLRETPRRALAKVHACVLIGEGPVPPQLVECSKPLLRARKVPVGGCGEALSGAPVIAFAGIGAPENFFASLRAAGAHVIAAHGFPDHAPYSRLMLERLLREATRADAFLVTTEKDMIRIPPEYYGYITPFVVELSLDPADRETLRRLVMTRIAARAALAAAGRGDFVRDISSSSNLYI